MLLTITPADQLPRGIQQSHRQGETGAPGRVQGGCQTKTQERARGTQSQSRSVRQQRQPVPDPAPRLDRGDLKSNFISTKLLLLTASLSLSRVKERKHKIYLATPEFKA